MKDIVIIGGGAAGLAAAVFAARLGASVAVYEKNEKTGKKLFITGKGRCNFTNVCGHEELLEAVVSNRRFLFSSFSAFSSTDAIELFEGLGVPCKVERGRRAFPASERSSDIIRALEGEARRHGVEFFLNCPVKGLMMKDKAVYGVVLGNGETVDARAVIVATGGLSYPSTGSTGDGYRFAKEAGIALTKRRPALVPLETAESYVKELQGLSLKNVSLTIMKKDKKLYEGFGELLFTHFGISGPLALAASSFIGKELENGSLQAAIDLKPALNPEQLDARLRRELLKSGTKSFKNAVAPLFPAKLLPVMVALGDIPGDRQACNVTKEERKHFADFIKNFSFTVVSSRSYNEAVITQGGVNVKEIDPATMEAKEVKGLYFAGEVLDIDAVTGGYNLQIAWSTAYKAATAACAKAGL